MNENTYAYFADTKNCNQCGKDHYYLTNHHIIITGDIQELVNVNLPFVIESFDPNKSDIKLTKNIFEFWPELRKYHARKNNK